MCDHNKVNMPLYTIANVGAEFCIVFVKLILELFHFHQNSHSCLFSKITKHKLNDVVHSNLTLELTDSLKNRGLRTTLIARLEIMFQTITILNGMTRGNSHNNS